MTKPDLQRKIKLILKHENINKTENAGAKQGLEKALEILESNQRDLSGLDELDTTQAKDATIHDWNLERKYANLVFNNENGKFLYDITVQNNKLSKFNYTFTPIQKVTTTTKERIFQPYISAGYSTLDIASVGGGFFYHNLGIEYQFQKDFRYNDTGHSLGIKYKF